MELEVIKKLIKKYAFGHMDFVIKSDTAKRYYNSQNDILKTKKEEKNAVRNADNRIPTNFYGLLVRQKSAYMFTYPPMFDTGGEELNDKINNILGNKLGKVCKDLCVEASNTGIGWLHCWRDGGTLKYGVVDSRQIIPIWGSELENKLNAVFRTYIQTDDDGEAYRVYEYWNDRVCEVFRKKESDSFERLAAFDMFGFLNGLSGDTNIYEHRLGGIPFVPFFNNADGTGDLWNVKGLIDSYDKVFNGFLNDLEDIQEIIFILKGYDGTELESFLSDLKKYKTIKLDGTDGAGLETVSISIPVEARKEMLTICRKAIFEQGQGLDPDPQSFGNSSGVALKFMYSLLELKAGMLETEFRLGFDAFIRLICGFLGENADKISQTWNRTAVTNDNDLAAIAKDSVGLVSNKTILKNHPFVEDTELELKQLKEENEGEGE